MSGVLPKGQRTLAERVLAETMVSCAGDQLDDAVTRLLNSLVVNSGPAGGPRHASGVGSDDFWAAYDGAQDALSRFRDARRDA